VARISVTDTHIGKGALKPIARVALVAVATGLVGSLYPLRVQDVTLRGKRALGVQVTATIVKCAGAVTRHAVAVKARVAGTVRAIRVLLRRLAVSTVVAAAVVERANVVAVLQRQRVWARIVVGVS